MMTDATKIQTIPKEILCLIPKFDGDTSILNLFIAKCEYVLSGSCIVGNRAHEVYLLNAISSKLVGKAASLLSNNPGIATWEQLKELLTQHFGDPRSEECIAIELETIKLKPGESYIQFCQRIQSVRSSLFAKVNRLPDEGIKAAKMIIYNNTALNIFLYNLPEDLIRVVRLKGCSDLEKALSIVTEEVNFQFQYSAKNKLIKQNLTAQQSSQSALRPLPMAQGFIKPVFNTAPQNNNFRFGIPQSQGFRPQFMQPNKFTTPQGQFRPPQNQFQRNFVQTPFQQPRAPFQHGGFKYGVPQQQGFKFGTQNQPQINQNQPKFGISNQQQAPRFHDTDVSMRTAPVRQNMIANDLYYIEEPSQGQEYSPEMNYVNDYNNTYEMCGEYVAPLSAEDCHYLENHEATELTIQERDPENFQGTASRDQTT